MNAKEHYILGNLWLEKLRKYIRSFYKTIYLGSPVFILLNIVFCFSFQKDGVTNFWVLFIPMTIFSTAFCTYFPLRAIKRYKSIVQAFNLKNETEINLTLIDGKMLTLSEYEIRDAVFKVGNTEKASKLIICKSDEKDYTIIPEFFTHPPVF